MGIGKAASARAVAGQMTVELAVAMPVLIVVAMIAVNACTFFVDCAKFDRVAQEAVRVHAVTPGYKQTTSRSCDLIKQEVQAVMDASNLKISVSSSPAEYDFERFTATLEYEPTLFGLSLRSRVFGVELPRATHSTSVVVDVYKPGVIV